ncbi:hypothetical protein D7Y13_20300 [Corallococcus praedator]|uniref:Uncharacterized protein n=1 Tax=Corallococcus praedator TaxID=2316724 RepID=A0ABX9QFB3_9BACT|nr:MULTISPECIES: hypothetical protein [Corallococcus]RKH26645.1 hypothetical protein D7X75_27935 [Corallococcus sp. CA031C]RKI06380.1 hypothetical protein D7Y13_20300 [Corallococcus praedator]
MSTHAPAASGPSSAQVSRAWTHWIRLFHRWLSIAFTVAVIVNIVAMAKESTVVWVGFLALIPLALLLFSGLYLFVLPYAHKWRSGRRTD